jgi:hypothetical protein
LAIGVKPNYEIPVSSLVTLDDEQTIEGFLFKKAKSHNIENFQLLSQVVDSDMKMSSLEMFSRHSFTFEDPEFIGTLTDGMKPI